MTATFFDDLSNQRHLAEVLAIAEEQEELSLEELRTIACGQASRLYREWHGEHWTLTLIEALERGGIGWLERRAGGLVFRFADELPTAEDAWAAVYASTRNEDDDDEGEELDAG